MASTSPLPIRFSPEIHQRLDEASAQFGITKTAFIKLAVSMFCDDFEKRGMKSLPASWEEILRNADGRAHRYSNASTGGYALIADTLTGKKFKQEPVTYHTAKKPRKKGRTK